ncbi:MAG TPA: DUF4388 domain-containing protein [Thermoanaerobaculia bacterium]|nr:DUF4388 domain-containing protein [Thermoanaerobaculia bacterium]
MTDLSIRGSLDETTVPDLFRSLIRSGETAIASFDGVGRSDVVYFREGRIISASSSDPDTGLGEILLRSGELTVQQYQHAMEKTAVARRTGAVLVELGYLQPEELMRASERQVSAIVSAVLAYRSGTYTVEFVADLPPEIIALPIPTERLLLDALRGIEYWSLVWRGIGRLDRLLEVVPGADMRAYQLEMTDEENHILSLLNEPRTVEALCARSYLPNFVTCRTVWGLLTVNFIRDAEESGPEQQRTTVESEYELEALVEGYNGVFQSIFGLVFQRIGDHIYDFMDRVVLKVSPATMPYLSGMTLVNEGRIDFDQLYNNVFASGSNDPFAVIENILGELLAGWILEVRREFGPEMEKEVIRLAQRLKKSPRVE